MQKILLPISFSNHSLEVVNFAAKLAHLHQAQIIVLHVFGKPNVLGLTNTQLEENIRRTEQRLAQFVGNTISKDIKLEYRAVINYPADAILEVAKNESIDLIVIGMRNRDVPDNFWGQKALRILDETNCPLLVIPKDVKFSGINNIVLTVNLEKMENRLIDYFDHLRGNKRVHLYCVHVLEDEEKQVVVWKNINNLEGIYRGENIYFDTIKGSLQLELNDYAARKDADIVAMVNRKQGFFARLLKDNETKMIAQKLRIPFLIIKG